jgi:hypothetical protein
MLRRAATATIAMSSGVEMSRGADGVNSGGSVRVSMHPVSQVETPFEGAHDRSSAATTSASVV